MRRILVTIGILALLSVLTGAGFLVWGYYYITRDLPKLTSIEDYRPKMVSTVFASDGTPVAEFFEERRYPTKLREVPVFVRNAFLAAEDAAFYRHKGIDPTSIIRAIVHNVQSGTSAQGGSTITQQVVKNLLLTPERKIRRKIKEAILSYQLEKRFSKDEILEIYLNQIFFGNTAYGIKAAARVYYRKDLSELTLAEAALLAGLPKAPTKFSPLLNYPRAKRRQRYVLDQMVKGGFVSAEAAEAAGREKIRVYPASYSNFFRAPYYVGEVRREIAHRWPDLPIDTEGLQIYTALDLNADAFASKALQRGLREVDKRRGWRGPIGRVADGDPTVYRSRYALNEESRLEADTVYPALVEGVSRKSKTVRVIVGAIRAEVDLKEASWAKRILKARDSVSYGLPEEIIREGDVIEVSLPQAPETSGDSPGVVVPALLDQAPEVEGAVTIIDPHSGKVVSMVGGYSYGRSVFNRVTQSLRQPGSAFKPVVYLAAVDGFRYTPSTIVQDSPRTFRVGDEYWTPRNFDESYMGPITLRVALEKSRNLVSADIVSRIGISAILQYAQKLGFTSKLGRNLSISLGSSEVTLLELVRAYGVFASGGVLFDSVLVTKIIDRNGAVIYDYEHDPLSKATRAIDEKSAFIMANMLKGVVESGTGYRVKELGRPVAGKTGTSNDHMDAWFIGFTPRWACGVWIGFDTKRDIGSKETGGRVAAPIFLYAMRDFLNYQDRLNRSRMIEEAKVEAERLGIDYVEPELLPPIDFSVPDGVDPYWINKQSGLLSDEEQPGAFREYFVRGTEPRRGGGQEDSTSYLESPEL